MRQLRLALGQGDAPEVAEHLNRRLRQLRKDGWVITSYKDSRDLPVDTYRLDARGEPIWHGKRKAKDAISQSTRRLVFDRDGFPVHGMRRRWRRTRTRVSLARRRG